MDYALNYTYKDIFHEKYKGDFNPFLFFIFSKFTFSLFKTDWSLRLVSIFGYFASIYVYNLILNHFKYKKYEKWTGLIIFSTMPILIQYSIFARPYTLLLLISLLIVFFFIRESVQSKIENYIYYIITLSVGFYIHFFTALFVFIFSIVILIIYNSRVTITAIKKFIIATIILFITILPEINSLLIKVKTVSKIQQDISLQPFYKKFAFLIHSLIFGETQIPTIFTTFLFGLLAFFIIFYNKNIVIKKSNNNLNNTNLILFSTLFVIFSCIIITITGFPRPMYIIFTTPFVSIIISKTINDTVRYTKFILITIVAFIHLIPIYNNLTNNTSQFVSPQYGIDYKNIVPDIERKANSETLFLVSPSFNKPIFQLYSQEFKTKNNYFFNPYDSVNNQIENINKYNNRNLIFINEHHNEKNTNLLAKSFFKRFDVKEKILVLKHKSYTKNQIYNYFEVVSYQIK